MPDENIFAMRPIEARDDAAIAAVIRRVMPEFGADGPGFAIHDAEVVAMSAAYTGAGRGYFVIEIDGTLQGGAGFAPLDHGDTATCELRKMYLLRTARGFGAGRALIEHCLGSAREQGFEHCYLETLTGMDAAQRLYVANGFRRIECALGNTGHHGCNRFYLRHL